MVGYLGCHKAASLAKSWVDLLVEMKAVMREYEMVVSKVIQMVWKMVEMKAEKMVEMKAEKMEP